MNSRLPRGLDPRNVDPNQVRAVAYDNVDWMIPSIMRATSLYGGAVQDGFRGNFTVVTTARFWLVTLGLVLGVYLTGLVPQIWIIPAFVTQLLVLIGVLVLGNSINDRPALNAWLNGFNPNAVSALSVVLTGTALWLAVQVAWGLLSLVLFGLFKTILMLALIAGIVILGIYLVRNRPWTTW